MTKYTPETLRAIGAKAAREHEEMAGFPGSGYISRLGRTMITYADAWEKEHAQVEKFIRDLYTGRFGEREKYYHALPQWIKDAIESDPIYNEAPGAD